MKPHEKVKAWLAQERRTQIWLADQIGARHEVVNRWLSGKVVPLAVFCKALADVTGLDVADRSAWAEGANT